MINLVVMPRRNIISGLVGKRCHMGFLAPDWFDSHIGGHFYQATTNFGNVKRSCSGGGGHIEFAYHPSCEVILVCGIVL
jgi:hypothetical protein